MSKSRKILRLVTIGLFWSIVLVNSFKPANAQNSNAANNQAEAEIVCLSTSGNGYNWAATFTWAAEIIKDAIAQAPTDARFNVACVSGASSGSAFVAAYGSLLQNKQLFDRTDFNPQNITRNEAQLLSNSLLYMALAADFRPAVVNFYTTLDGDDKPNPPWWTSQYSLERVMLDFGTRVMLAQHISPEDVSQVTQLDRFRRYKTSIDLKIAAKNRQVRQEYRQVTFNIWNQSQTILDRLYQNANYPRSARENDRDDFRDNPNHPVRKALARQPADGILALTYAELAFTESTEDYRKMRSLAPPAETLVPFVVTNKTTAKQIIESPFYQQQVKSNDPYVKQYVINVVPDYYTMIRHGVKEPDLLPVGLHRLSPLLEGSTSNLAAGVSHFYQPLAEKNWRVSPQFKLIRATRTWFRGEERLNARMGVAGGWIDSYVGGQATLYLGSSYALKKSSSSLYYSTFSRQDSVTEFAGDVIRKYFAPENPTEAIEAIEKHRAHLPVLIERYRQQYGNHNITWQPIFVDWSVRVFPENRSFFQSIASKIDNVLRLGFSYFPAATTRQSNYLLARTTNIVRKTLDRNLNYIYDRSYEDRYYEESNYR